jgi:hypothetical protein
VQHGGEANASPQVFWVGRNGDQRLGGGPEQQVVDDGFVLERDWRDRRRQGENDVIVGDRQQIVSLGFQPLSRRRALALRAMTVPASNGRRPLPALWADPVMGSWRAGIGIFR